MILVTGATGTIGAALTTALSRRGERFRVLTRDPGKVAHLDAVAADLTRPETLDFTGVTRLFLLDAGPGADGTANAVAAARRAGVGRVVALSTIGVTLDPMPRLGAAHAEREQIVRESGIPATFLRPGHLASNTLAWAPSIKAAGLVRHPLAGARHPLLAPEDVGEVAARVLTEDGHEGAAHTLTGEESLSVAEQAAVIGAAIGRDLAVAEISLDEAEAAMVARGMPPATAAAVRELHGFTREGRTDIVTGTVRELLGRAPRSFRWWCAENAAAFS